MDLLRNKHRRMLTCGFSMAGLSCNTFSGQLELVLAVSTCVLGYESGFKIYLVPGLISRSCNVHDPAFISFEA